MSRARDSAGTVNNATHATPRELVRALETSIAARLTAADQARDEVALAQVQAEHLIAAAEAQAAEVAGQGAATILFAARAEAARLTQAGIRRAADLTAVAARRRAQDVATVVAAVLPRPEETSRP